MKKLYSILLGVILVSGGMLVSAPPASATNGNVTGYGECNEDGTWDSQLTWNSTNVPSNVYGEVKATATTAGTLSAAPGQGVMSGSQVILAAFPNHVNNWPGVKTHKGNWSDQFSVVSIPASVDSITVTVQYDYDNGHSGDPTKTIYKPSDCHVVSHGVENQSRVYEPPADCSARHTTRFIQTRHRSWTETDGARIYEDWSDWQTVHTVEGDVNPAYPCPPTPPVTTHEPDFQMRTLHKPPTCKSPRALTIYQFRSRTVTKVDGEITNVGEWGKWQTRKTVKHGPKKDCVQKLHLVINDLCSCKHDSVKITGAHLAWKSIRQNKNVFTIHVVADKGWLVPVNIKRPWGASAHSATYTVKTTNTKCACPPHHQCSHRPPPPPKPVCPCKP